MAALLADRDYQERRAVEARTEVARLRDRSTRLRGLQLAVKDAVVMIEARNDRDLDPVADALTEANRVSATALAELEADGAAADLARNMADEP